MRQAPKHMYMRDRVLKIIFVGVFISIIFGVGLFTVLMPPAAFSEQENRALIPAPELNMKDLLSGEYAAAVSAFFSDHIPGRRQLVRMGTYIDLAQLKFQSRSVIFLPDGSLCDRCEYDSDVILEKNLDALEKFSKSISVPCDTVFVPRCIDILGERSPLLYSDRAEVTRDRAYSYAHRFLYDDLLYAGGEGEQVFYRTDHHLTGKGVYLAYKGIADMWGFEPYSDYSVQTVSEDFAGTTWSKGGMAGAVRDSVQLYRYDGEDDITVCCEDGECDISSFYDFSYLDKKDKYSVFFGGNHGQLCISSKTQQREKILIIKDSFANALIPMLSRHYDIVVVDTRYLSTPLSRILNENEFDKILIFCGIDTLCTDSFFEKLLY